ncbi:MAG TPA: SDR family NAD(P)-dependent oxidoreductase, partial [Kineosporiaceae bacterium]
DAEAADVRAVCLALGAEGTGPEALTLAEDGLDVVLVPGSGPEALRAVIRAVRELAHRPGDVRLAVVSRGALAGSTAPDPDAAALLGLVTVAQNEHPEQRIRMLDLDGELPAPELAALVRAWRARTDDLCAVRDGRLLRVVRRSRGTPGAMPAVRSAGTGEVPFRVVAGRSGEFGSVGCEVHRPPGTVGPGEVRVQILAASLNFRDVLVTQNALPPAAFGDNRELGLDAAGRVVEAGRDVHHVAVGDEVICCGRGLLASECVVPGGFVQRVPAGMSLPEAAALPMVLVTAWQGLVDLARVQPGETVLVHSAAGGLGLAAVHLAHALGARVIGTAGTSEKRALLRHLGVEVVANSRDASWAAAVRDAVPGGVDVVLNSLTGDMLALGLEVLAPGGRFIEVGKRDIYGGSLLGLRPLGKAVTIASVDVAGMLTDRPERFAALLEDAWKAVSERMVPALPVTRFPFARADDAFRALASGTVIGKVVLDDPSSVTGRVRPRPWSGVVAAGGCHVITGGLGAMGLALAEHLAGRGVRDVALLGRSAPGAAAAARVTALGALGVRVSVHACDVAERDQLAAALAEVRRRHGSIVAVHHTAGVLQDATLATTADADLAAVYHAKVGGARLLDELTSADPIEAFVLFSSAAVVIGSPGQGGYAAANACLDGLARRRRAEGRAGLSIQWPPVRGAGLGAESGGTARLADLGLSTLEPQDCGPILDRLLEDGEVCVSPMRLDVERWSESYPATVTRSSWAELPAGPVAARGGEGLASRLADLEPEHQRRRLVDVVTAQACRILRVTAGELDLDVPLRSVGLDSLMTLELRSALEREVGTRVSPTLLWTHGSPRAIASALSELVSSDPAARVGARVGPGPVAGPPR